MKLILKRFQSRILMIVLWNSSCSITLELKLALSNRFKTTPISAAIVEVFGKYEWYDANKFNSLETVALLIQKVTDICSKLEGPFKTKFYNSNAIDDIVTGYNLFMRFTSRQKSAEKNIRVEDVHKLFWLRHKDINETSTFGEFFEFAQGKSYSEAMCKNIGSIMNMATAKGQNLHPANFGKEIFLRFNLHPMHVLHQGFRNPQGRDRQGKGVHPGSRQRCPTA